MCTTNKSPAEIKGDIAAGQRIYTDRLVLKELVLELVPPWEGELDKVLKTG